LNREVALKLLSQDLADNPVALKRFQAEAEAVARATHGNIVQVYAVGEADGLRYMALEYVAGRNLRDYLDRKGPPELSVALSLIRQVAAALARASELGLVHRDIKPENILITKRAEVKVADFGLSRYVAPDEGPVNLTKSGMTVGTPLYMAPEQVRGEPVDHRSDIYSFGVTCYHMLAGRPPFRGGTAFDVAAMHVRDEPPPLAEIRPDLPADLCAMVHKMMAKRPADRYQSARDIIRDVAKLQRGLPVELPAPVLTSSGSQPLLPARPAGGSRWGLRLVLAVGATLLGWWLYGIWHPRPDPAPPAGPGLPDIARKEPYRSARERDLQATIDSRSATPHEVFEATLSLALVYLQEGREAEAEKLFAEMIQQRPTAKPPLPPALLTMIGQLGQAIVLARRDQAKESIELFERAVPNRPRGVGLENFLLAHPEFAQAIAEALARNADTLGRPKLSDRLEWLRTPAGLIRAEPK
jgi:serine/threonine-protein kinase